MMVEATTLRESPTSRHEVLCCLDYDLQVLCFKDFAGQNMPNSMIPEIEGVGEGVSCYKKVNSGGWTKLELVYDLSAFIPTP